MLPVTTTSAYTTPPPLVNTTTPGTTVVHVPPDTVAPSFSSPQVDTNARGNNAGLPASQPPPQPQSQLSADASAFPTLTGSNAQKFTLGAQANFIAQLIGQDITPSVQGILVQYEKLVNIGNVKYKPSDAFKPQAEPSSLFGKLLQADAQPARQFTPVLQAFSPEALPEQAIAATPLADVQAARANSKTAAQSLSETIAEEDAAHALESTPASQPAPRSAISAYVNTASRVKTQSLEKPTEDAISHIA
jgi:hypothetical protein